MRLVDARSSSELPPIMCANPCPNVERTYTLEQNDDKTPAYSTLYFLSDIHPILQNESYYHDDADANGANFASITWVVMSFINGRTKYSSPQPQYHQTTPNVIPGKLAGGSVIVLNGSTPCEDKESDYHNWYNQEHGLLLANVPGWKAGRRYRVEKVYGDIEEVCGASTLFGLNVYDEQNGLGGPVWQASVHTDWTKRIQSQRSKPNYRAGVEVVIFTIASPNQFEQPCRSHIPLLNAEQIDHIGCHQR